MTILSVNKTRAFGCSHVTAPIFWQDDVAMKQKSRYLAQGALLAALYAALAHGQNFLLPGSATLGIQLRAAEMLCVLAFFTPAAIPGLTVGCFIFNITTAGALPLDPVVGSGATFLAAWAMYRLRHFRLWGLPLAGLLMPALINGVLVGWELTVYIGGSFWGYAAWVAAGEAVVLLLPGSILYSAIRRRGLQRYIV